MNSQLSHSSVLARAVSRSAAFVTAVALLASCSDRKTTASVDSALLRDLTLASAPAPGTAASTLGDTAAASPKAVEAPPAAAPAPVRETPRPSTASRPVPARVTPRPAPPVAAPTPSPVTTASAPAPSAPTPTPVPASAPATASPASGGTGRRAIGAGTTLSGKTDAQICSLANRPGDRFVATLSEAVTGADGARIPAGTPILVEMATPSTEGGFAFRAKAVQVNGTLIPIEGAVTVSGDATSRRVSQGGDKGKVIGGAVAGAILGRVLGGGTRGTVIGAAGGAAAGTVLASRSGVTERCLPAGSTLSVTLSAPIVLTTGVP